MRAVRHASAARTRSSIGEVGTDWLSLAPRRRASCSWARARSGDRYAGAVREALVVVALAVAAADGHEFSGASFWHHLASTGVIAAPGADGELAELAAPAARTDGAAGIAEPWALTRAGHAHARRVGGAGIGIGGAVAATNGCEVLRTDRWDRLASARLIPSAAASIERKLAELAAPAACTGQAAADAIPPVNPLVAATLARAGDGYARAVREALVVVTLAVAAADGDEFTSACVGDQLADTGVVAAAGADREVTELAAPAARSDGAAGISEPWALTGAGHAHAGCAGGAGVGIGVAVAAANRCEVLRTGPRDRLASARLILDAATSIERELTKRVRCALGAARAAAWNAATVVICVVSAAAAPCPEQGGGHEQSEPMGISV